MTAFPSFDVWIFCGSILLGGGIICVAAVFVWRSYIRQSIISRLFLDTDDVAKTFVSAEDRIVFQNAAAVRLWKNKHPRDALSHRIDSADEDAFTALQRLLAASMNSVAERVDIVMQGEKGLPEWWRVAVHPVAVEHRSVVSLRGVIWTAVEVTAQRAIEDILRQDRDESSEFLYLMPVGLYSVDAAGVLRFVNQRLADWLGYSPDALCGRPLARILEGNHTPEHEGMWSGRLVFRCQSGETFPAFVEQSIFDDAGETKTRTVVTCLAEDEGRGDHQPHDLWFWSLFENLPLGLCLIDVEGLIVEVNKAFFHLCGLDKATLKDIPLSTILSDEDQDMWAATFDRVVLDGSQPAVPQAEVYFRDRPDSAASFGVVPLGGAMFMAHFADTTARRNLEIQFEQAQKMQAMGQLAGGVAHDFNNLLTAMIGFCDLLLQRHSVGDPSFADLMQVKQNANRAANLVRQLLAFSRKQPLQACTIRVTDALTEISHLLRRLLGERIHLDLRLGRDVGCIRVDPGQFDQVIINLAVNARDAMPDGGHLTLTTHHKVLDTSMEIGAESLPAGDYVVITVHDTGSGIGKEDIARIFEPFFSTKAGVAGAGTGLGLSTVYGIVRQTGGGILAESVVGKGTTFVIYLPCDERDSFVSDGKLFHHSDENSFEEGDKPSDCLSRANILLVEDEDAVRVFAVRALRNKGHRVIEAASGEQALELLGKEGPIDLLITDMIMPGIDGATLARRVRAERGNVRVILVSGYSEEAARGGIADSPDFSFLPKPFSLKQLAARVHDVLGEQLESVDSVY